MRTGSADTLEYLITDISHFRVLKRTFHLIVHKQDFIGIYIYDINILRNTV